MCNKHSFVMDASGRCYNASGVSESHSAICQIHGLRQDSVNMYEWRRPAEWPSEDWTAGFLKDTLNFHEKSTHVNALERYIRQTFPTRQAWDAYVNYDLHGLTFKTNGHKVIIAIGPEKLIVKTGLCWAYDLSMVVAWDQSTVRAHNHSIVQAHGQSAVEAHNESEVWSYDHSTVVACEYSIARAYNHSIVRAYDHSVIKAYGQSTIEAYGHSTIEAVGQSTVVSHGESIVEAREHSTVNAYGNTVVTNYSSNTSIRLKEHAVLIDRTNNGQVSVRKARKAR